jgi:hypothetical protein
MYRLRCSKSTGPSLRHGARTDRNLFSEMIRIGRGLIPREWTALVSSSADLFRPRPHTVCARYGGDTRLRNRFYAD